MKKAAKKTDLLIQAVRNADADFDLVEIKKSPRCRQMGGAWASGKTSDGCTFNALVFEEPSEWGIETPRFPEGGNVSKLAVFDERGRAIAAYDRGWGFDGYPEDEDEETVHTIIGALETAFCR